MQKLIPKKQHETTVTKSNQKLIAKNNRTKSNQKQQDKIQSKTN